MTTLMTLYLLEQAIFACKVALEADILLSSNANLLEDYSNQLCQVFPELLR
jgi:hypothetical protein